ncbi:MAG: polyphosphate polymerase domain-containing protein [Oscillospiraceae bacterium]|nr:polyphosphate polymerase domain-containing protein [Oscillospiraceae bacterium]
MQFRHELKHTLSVSEATVLRKRLAAVMQRDAHGKNGIYTVRSLYFDTPFDKALREKINGTNCRSKYRLRMYDGNSGLIRLEKKSKQNGLCSKQSALLTPQEAARLIAGEHCWVARDERQLLQELALMMRTEQLRPKTVVDYCREAFVCEAGNVRVTLDSDVRTGLRCTDFLDSACVTVAVPQRVVILEVKWDAYLPEHIRALVQMGHMQTAFSKYAACRSYG